MVAKYYQFRHHSHNQRLFAFELASCDSLDFTQGDHFIMVYEPYTMVGYLWTDHVT